MSVSMKIIEGNLISIKMCNIAGKKLWNRKDNEVSQGNGIAKWNIGIPIKEWKHWRKSENDSGKTTISYVLDWFWYWVKNPNN